MSEFTITDRVLNIYYTINSARSLYKLMTGYLLRDQRPGQRSKMEHFLITVFNYSCKKLHLKSLRGF